METIAKKLAEITARGLYRQVDSYQPQSPTKFLRAGKEYLVLSSNNYLGLTHHPLVMQAAKQAVDIFGAGSGGARLTTGCTLLHNELEKALAQFKGTQAVRLFNTGYMANVGVISALGGLDDAIFSDELNHASIVDGCRLSKAKTYVYRHSDMDSLEYQLKNASQAKLKLIVTDGVFSMDGDIARLDDIVMLAEKYQAMVMVDDAHAVGVIGTGGRGTVSYFGLEKKVDVQVGTMSKALASEGGYVAGSKILIDYITNCARSFIFSTALSAVTVASAYQALRVLEENPQLVSKLQDNADYLRTGLKMAGLPVIESATPIIPVVIGDARRAVQMAVKLNEEGILVPAVRPPTVPENSSRLRITVSASHTKEELKFAADKIISIARDLEVMEG